MAQIFVERFTSDYEKPEKVNMKWWKKKFQELDKPKNSKVEGEMEKMRSRLRFKLYAMIYEKQQFAISEPSPTQRAFCKELYKMIYPNWGN